MQHHKGREQSGFDNTVDKINRKIARILGKKGNHKVKPQNTSSLVFWLLVILLSGLLWLVTGFYYLGEGQYGLVMTNGKIVHVVTGLKVGFTLPYPYGSIMAVDGKASNMLILGNAGPDKTSYLGLSNDGKWVALDVQFAYQIVNPVVYYNNYDAAQNNLDNLVRSKLQLVFRDYLAQKDYIAAKNANLTVIGNNVRDKASVMLSKYGITMVKLSINRLQTYDENSSTITDASVKTVQLAKQLLSQAQSYQDQTLIQAKNAVAEYERLLPLYQQSPKVVASQLYFNTLEQVRQKNSNGALEQYPLLNLSLPELKSRVAAIVSDPDQSNALNNQQQVLQFRQVDRSVSRQRNLD